MTTVAFASTNISLTPTSVNVQEGQIFSLQVSVAPQGVKNYTIKTEVAYPADLLEVKSFTFGSSWMPLSQPGYDLIDNKNGVLIKTAGYPGGASDYKIFGTITFMARKTGNGSIKTTTNSLALDSTNTNTLSGISASSVVINSAPAPKPVVTNKPVEKKGVVVTEPIEDQVVNEEIGNALTEKGPSLMASMIAFVDLFPISLVLGIAIGATAMFVLAQRKPTKKTRLK